MSRLVVDCSVTAAWLFEDEASPYAEAVLDALAADHEALAPAIWLLEVSNVMLVGERRARLTEVQSIAFWVTLKAMPISIDEREPKATTERIIALGRAHALSAYDAAYLELALSSAVPIASLDDKLTSAARASGIAVWQSNS